MPTAVATLSLDGWLKNTSSICDALFADFLVSAYSQYPQGKIEASLSWLLVKHQDDVEGLCEDVVRVLTAYFQTSFPKADVVCRSAPNTEDAGRIELYITATVVDEDGASFTLGRIATVGEQRVLTVAKDLNGSLPVVVG